MQDSQLDPMTGPQSGAVSGTHLVFWPGEDDLAAQLALWLDTPPPVALDRAPLPRGPRVVVLWRGPDHALAACLTRGQGVARALTDWKSTARGLLHHARQNRRSLILAEASALRQGGLGPLADRLALANPPTPLPQTTGPLAVALARLALQDDPDLRQLLDDLTSASLPGPDQALGDLLTQVAADQADAASRLAALQTDAADLRHALHDAAATRDAALAQSDLLQGQIPLLQASLAQQSAAELARSQAATLQVTALQAVITAQDQDLARLQAALAARSEDADLALTQLHLGDSSLTQHLSAAQTRADAADLRIRALQGELALTAGQAAAYQSDLIRLQSALNDLNATHADTMTELALHRAQLGLTQDGLIREVAGGQTRSEVVSLRVRTLDSQLALMAQTLADRDAELALLRAQLGVAQDSLTRNVAGGDARADAASLRVQTLENQLALTAQTLADRDAELALHRAQLDVAQDSVTRSLDQTHAVALLSDAQAEADLLRTQIALLQSSLTRALTAPAADVAPVTADDDYWDKALARALTAARTEAEQRARLERELATLKNVGQMQTRRADEDSHTRKLFSQMTKEATASLDEIARLSAALALTTG